MQGVLKGGIKEMVRAIEEKKSEKEERTTRDKQQI
jgi:hypothetical protein